MAREQNQKQLASIPMAFRGDFLEFLKGHADPGLASAFQAKYEAVIADLGGKEGIATAMETEARDFAALDMVVLGQWCRVFAGKSSMPAP